MKKLFLFVTALITVNVVIAQKLPNVQTASLRASANIKVDGKATEWDNKLQAYNKATDVFYALANDDEVLYIIVQAKDPDVINKIADGGVTFTIKKSKNVKENMSFTFPINDNKKPINFNLKYLRDTSAKAVDSIMMRNNKTLTERHKLIRVTGVEGIDTLISIYNENGIKAAGMFDNKKVYTFEMTVKLKSIGLYLQDETKFPYQLKVNGKPIAQVTSAVNGQGVPPEILAQVLSDLNARMSVRSAPTDFSGEYTLAK